MSVLSRVVFETDTTPPTTPLSVTATALSTTTIRITWGASSDQGGSGLSGYRVYRATTSGGTYTQVDSDLSIASLSYDDTSLSPGTTRFYRVAAFDGNGNVSAQSVIVSATTSATAPGTYTPTHYVAPFASVAGAANDYTDLGQPAFNAATNSSTPTTLGTASRWYVPGNRIRIEPGVLMGENWNLGAGASTHRDVGCFHFARNGTAQDPVIFFARYPATANYGSTALYTEVRRPNPPEPITATASPPILITGAYVFVDGLYADERVTIPGPDSNLFRFGGGNNNEFRRCAVDRDPTPSPSYNGGYNANPFGAYNSINCRIVDCYVKGSASGAHLNHSAMDFYGNQGMVVEYCTIEDGWYSVFAKTDDTFAQDVTFRFNKFLNGMCGIAHQTNSDGVVLTQNLMIVNHIGVYFDNQASVLSPATVTNNTIILKGASAPQAGPGGLYFEGNVNHDGSTYRDNLVYIKSGTHSTVAFVQRDANANTGWADITFNHNHYFDAGGSPTWINVGATYASIVDWRTAIGSGAEVNSTYSDPQFVDAANDDYRLNTGSPARTSSSAGGPVGCYINGNEEIGVRANPTY